jgi:tetratricopeptide (TPR) repeat protein/CHAT domain-containing protein
MNPIDSNRARDGGARSRLATAALGLWFLLGIGASGHADDPPGRLSPERREELERRAEELWSARSQLYERGALGDALEKSREGLGILERLYPERAFPQGHPDLARSLNEMGFLLKAQGAYGEARGYLERGLRMQQSLYPEAAYSRGHPNLATSLGNLGQLLQAQAAYGAAREYLERAVAMQEALYPIERYPQGHQDLASSLSNLGFVLKAQGADAEARGYYEQALAMKQALYPKQRYPGGHPSLALALNNLGAVLQRQGDYIEARKCYQQALEMRQALFPKERYPRGHPDLAQSLNNLGALLRDQAAFAEARGYYEQALTMKQALFTKERYPRGHPELARSLNNVGAVVQDQGSFAEAQDYYERAMAMNQALYAKERYPGGHPDLARSLNNLGFLLRHQGAYAGARAYLQRALAMNQGLYPVQRYPQGHPDLASSLNNLGFLLEEQGAYVEAGDYLRRALEMNQVIYPTRRYPKGHPELARSLDNLGVVLEAQGIYAESRDYRERSRAMIEGFYPKEQYPKGHPELARSLIGLGSLLEARGDSGEAGRTYERALAMNQDIYPKEQYPNGHPDMIRCLKELGFLVQAQGNPGAARAYLERALKINRSVYPKDLYPQGHPELAHSLKDLGELLSDQGAYDEALPVIEQAADMLQGFSDILLTTVSEAEAMNYLAQLPMVRDGLISTSLHVPESDSAAYARVWSSKAAVSRILRRRQAALVRRTGIDPATRRKIEGWRDTRSQLARLLLATADGRDHPERLRRLQQLGTEKERLERELAEALPDFARSETVEHSAHTRLVEAIPEGTVVLDLVHFTRFEPGVGKPGDRRTPGYVGFVLARGRPVRMVDLGAARAIDDAVRQWRGAIVAGQASPAATTLRRLVWEPLAGHIPPATTTVIVAPDGELTGVPWSALPGDRPGTVLLEQYALATVPHAPFLLDRLTAPTPTDDARGRLLAVGGVAYDRAPRPIDDPKARIDLLAARRAEDRGGPGDGWKGLPGTLRELDDLSSLAGPRALVRLQGDEAGTAQFLRELPRARWAHIATHGFFADPDIPSALRPDPRLFASVGGERVGAGLRNPLVLSGLVLAGANRPAADVDGSRRDDRGILTAEAIAGLPLHDLELVVLSACETGLGTVGGGEGVFGLQRAFHLAGAHDVVASLWKVEDEATAALMAIFYEQLWRQHKPPIEALRTAQLTLYRHPERVGELSKSRGTPDFDKVVRRPEPTPGAGGPGSSPKDRAPAKQWAAFILSGGGR